MRRPVVDLRFSAMMRRLIERRGMSFRTLAAWTYFSKSYLQDLAAGNRYPTPDTARHIDEAMGAGGELVALVAGPVADTSDDELDALELTRRVSASDVSAETLERVERAADELSIAYATTPPELLLPRVRRHLAYVTRLLDVRSTMDQRRRLLVAGALLSLLGATVHIDLRQSGAAAARLTTADQLAGHAEHAEIRAWCLETKAWDVLTSGDFQRAVDLSRQAQTLAPKGSSAHIQATAQEGRGWARMGKAAETRAVLTQVGQLTTNLPVPDQPEHHYKYDPAKAVSYTATTLAWAGDPAAEEYARTAIAELEAAHDGAKRPRRIASARLDLGLSLLAARKPDEAAAEALAAITSGRVVPSNWWRAAEVVRGVERSGIGEADELRDAFETFQPGRVADR